MSLKEALEEKKSKSLLVVAKVVMDVPRDFQTIETKYNALFDKNSQFSSNLTSEKQKARDTLRYHEIKLKVDEFDYSNESTILTKYETIVKNLQTDLEVKKSELKNKKLERQNIVSQSMDENMAAENINKLLRGLGSKSFSLEHIDNPNEQKGQYKIRGKNGSIRSVTELSEGEKNIVAFLYFMNGMGSTTENDYIKDKIIVLDDPMTSNDDVTQFLMMSVIQRYYGERESQSKMGKGDTLLILTHNTHFYLNVRPFKPRYKDGKYKTNEAYIFLKSDGSKTSVERITQDNDIKSGYDALWQELEFAYENDKTLFMWNNMRRIIETFAKFNNTEIAPLLSSFDNEEDNILGGLLRKSLNTNSHAILDFEFESDVFTKDQLIEFFSSTFEKLNASNHFNNYWKGGNEIVKKSNTRTL
jgi:wobble nucleotide-excising tRNase